MCVHADSHRRLRRGDRPEWKQDHDQRVAGGATHLKIGATGVAGVGMVHAACAATVIRESEAGDGEARPQIAGAGEAQAIKRWIGPGLTVVPIVRKHQIDKRPVAGGTPRIVKGDVK